MFSALKKLTTSVRPEAPSAGAQPGSVPMSDSLQKKFARGVQYNMKIIIKGDRNVGKTCLLQRLQGRTFLEAYEPSEEIQVASIQWSFKSAEADVVKVEVWDVVDRGKARSARTPANGLKLSNPAAAAAAQHEQPALDAEFLDVYKGTHGVVLMMDITKAWTFEYVCRELPRIPQDIPVLILGNHCDMAHHRVVSGGQVIGLIEQHADRPAEIHYGDSSMRNGFGLRLLHRFLGLPFLRLQKETLLSQLQRNQRETQTCSGDLVAFLQSDDANYEKFLEQLSHRRRQIADANPKNTAPSVLLAHSSSSTSIASSASSFDQQHRAAAGSGTGAGKSIIIGGGKPIVIPGQLNVTNDPRWRQQSATTTSATSVANANALPSSATSNVHTTVGFMSSLLGGSESATVATAPAAATNVLSVDEFCPDGGGGLDRGFLDDDATTAAPNPHNAHDESESDSDTANPMVARFHDEPVSGTLSMASSSPPARQNYPDAMSRVNPLAKGKATEASLLYGGLPKTQRTALTSEEDDIDLEVPTVIVDDDDDDVGTLLSHQRRSPEGLEDPVPRPCVALPEPKAVAAASASAAVSLSDEKSSSERKAAHRSKSKKKERNETKDERDARRAERRAKREAKEARPGSDDADEDPQRLDASYEAL